MSDLFFEEESNDDESLHISAGQIELIKTFTPNTIFVNNNSTITFTVTNNGGAPSPTGIQFTDNLPGGMVVAGSATVSGSWSPSPTVTTSIGSSMINVSGGGLPNNGDTGTITVTVTAPQIGMFSNDVTAFTYGGGSGVSTPGTLNVINPQVTFNKVFSPNIINSMGTSTLTFTITNLNGFLTLDNVAFTDTLPSGFVIANPDGLVSSGWLMNPTITATSNTNLISISGGQLPPSGPMDQGTGTISVNVTATTSGANTSSTLTGSRSSVPSGGTIASPAIASLTVNATTPTTTTTTTAPPVPKTSTSTTTTGTQSGTTITVQTTIVSPSTTTTTTLQPISPATSSAALPPITGTVTYSDNHQVIGKVVINHSTDIHADARATVTFTTDVSILPPGTHRIISTYSGDENYEGSSDTIVFEVLPVTVPQPGSFPCDENECVTVKKVFDWVIVPSLHKVNFELSEEEDQE